MNVASGALDRRITIEQATVTRDTAGDVLNSAWAAPTGWPNAGKRWASKRDKTPQMMPGDDTNQVTLRQIDTVFTVRKDRFSETIAPETFRVVHHGRHYLIVGMGEGQGRGDTLDLLCCSRPDMRGSSAPEG